MKVIKRGRKKKKEWPKKFICGEGRAEYGCGAKLLISQLDLYESRFYARDEYDTNDTYTAFHCPECGEETLVALIDSSK